MHEGTADSRIASRKTKKNRIRAAYLRDKRIDAAAWAFLREEGDGRRAGHPKSPAPPDKRGAASGKSQRVSSALTREKHTRGETRQMRH